MPACISASGATPFVASARPASGQASSINDTSNVIGLWPENLMSLPPRDDLNPTLEQICPRLGTRLRLRLDFIN